MPRSIKGAYRAYSRNPGKYNQSAAAKATQALAVAKAVKALVNVEYKNHDVLVDGASVLPFTAAGMTVLTNVPEGDGPNARDGNSVKLKSLKVRMQFNANTTSPSNGQTVRCLIVRDNQQQGTAPTVAQILAQAGTSSAAQLESLPNIIDFPGRFSILMDRTVLVDPDGNGGIKHMQFYKKFDNHLKFDGTGANAERKGALYYFAITNVGANYPTTTVQSRIRYIDN